MHFDRLEKYSGALRLTIATTALGLTACVSNAAGPLQTQLPAIQMPGAAKPNACG